MVNNKMNKEAKQALMSALNVLEHAMELALQKEDLDAMIAISDRLMMLYQHLSDKNVKKFKTGFGIMDPIVKNSEDGDEDESD
jgi:hypothetical protein